MKYIESIQSFYTIFPDSNNVGSFIDNSPTGHFNVFPRECCPAVMSYTRRDFYKIVLILGDGILKYGDKEMIIDRPALAFSSPMTPYSWEATSGNQSGWFCLFTADFMNSHNNSNILSDCPVFKMEKPIFFLEENSLAEVSDLFRKMTHTMSSDYIYKYDVLRNYLQLLIHVGLQLLPETGFDNQQTNAAHRIAFQFMEMVEKQFPIESPDSPLKLKSAQDFARILSVHINHMNHSVKEVTGKTTSEHIASRIIQEAKALLQYSDWSISEIAYALGFEYPSYFTNFVKKNTGLSPKGIRLKTL